MYNNYAPSGRSRRSTTERPPSRTRSPVSRPSQASQHAAPIDAMLGGLGSSAVASKEETSSFDMSSSATGTGSSKAAKKEPVGDLFAGLSHDVVPIQEEKTEPKKEKDDEFGGGFDGTFPEFDPNSKNNVPPPASVGRGNAANVDIGNNSIVQPGIRNADVDLTGNGNANGYVSGGSEYDEVTVTEMEEYEVQEKQMVTVPKEVKYMEMGELAVPVTNPKDVADGVYCGAGTYGDSQYFLTLKIFNTNRGHFVKSDKDKDGKLNVKEAWDFFQMAKMDPKVLQQAWKLVATTHDDADLPKDGLSEIQFHCMFQIILTMKRHGINDCPASIPPALSFDVIRMLGKPVNDGKVLIRKTIEKTRNEPVQEERMVTVKKQRPKKVKKRVKRGGNGSGGAQPGGASKKQPAKQVSPVSNVPPPSGIDDDFGFGNDDAPGAAATQVSNTNANAPSGGGGDDWGAGFDDFGASNGNSNGNSDKKAKEKKKDDAFLNDDDGFGNNNTGNTPGGGDWENWGDAGW